jgi:hypothetical protein
MLFVGSPLLPLPVCKSTTQPREHILKNLGPVLFPSQFSSLRERNINYSNCIIRCAYLHRSAPYRCRSDLRLIKKIYHYLRLFQRDRTILVRPDRRSAPPTPGPATRPPSPSSAGRPSKAETRAPVCGSGSSVASGYWHGADPHVCLPGGWVRVSVLLWGSCQNIL